jgi:tetratricopeptide (TPR) repeat protein
MNSSRLILTVFATVALATSLSAAGQDMNDAAVKCNSHVAADIIAGCTVIIDAGQETPEHLAMAYTYRGAAYSDQGDSDKAISDYSHAIKLDPTNPTAFFDRGVEYAVVQKYELSISDFSQAIALKPDYARAYLDRGRVYQAMGDNAHAQADFDKAQSLGQN